MPDNFGVLWLQQKLNQHANDRAAQAIQSTGRALPCSVTAINGSLVTVKFEVNMPCYTLSGELKNVTLPPLTLPKGEAQWMRSPTQVGDVGFTVPADTFLGGISGEGSGIADTGIDYGNLTSLVWVPVAATTFPAIPDTNKPWVNGPTGAIVSDTAQTVVSKNDSTSKTIAHKVSGAEGSGATTVGTLLDGINNTITHNLTNTLGTVETIIDGPSNKITHSLSSAAGIIQTIYDGNGNAISHVLPAGGVLGLGALASSLAAARAVPAQADLNTLSNNLLGTSIQSLMSIMSTAMISAGIPNAAAFEAIVTASGWIMSNISLPAIPGCSSIVRVSV